MSLDRPKGQDGIATATIAVDRDRAWKRRTRLIISSIGVFLIASMLGTRFLPSSGSRFGPFTVEADLRAAAMLSDGDKGRIEALARKWTYQHAFRALRSGEFRQFVRSLRIARQQKINRFIDDHDGTFRVYTVVDSPKEKEGFYPWSRLVIAKTNQWVIVRSY